MGPFAKTIRGLLTLHEIGYEARQTDAADLLRDELDRPWLALEDEQLDVANRVSALLLLEEARTEQLRQT